MSCFAFSPPNSDMVNYFLNSGVESFDVNLEEQKVTVKGNVQPDAVLQTVAKTGKATSFWEEAAPAEPEVKPAETVAAS